jgi:copper chaperone CopZ
MRQIALAGIVLLGLAAAACEKRSGEAEARSASLPEAAQEQRCEGMTEAGSCSGGCDQFDEAAAEVARRPVPASAVWQTIPVSGMVCGGCERRIIASVGQLQGVLAVEADAELGQVRIAMAPGKDLRRTAVARINSLGYTAK